MKVSLIALIASCAVTGSAFASHNGVDAHFAAPTQTDMPGNHPPQAQVADMPGNHPPQAQVTDMPGNHPPQIVSFGG